MSEFEQGNYNLGTGDQFNAEEQHFEITRYEYYNLGSGGRTCPKGANPPGCGGSLKKTELVWREHSLHGRPLNNLGKSVAPPPRPRLTETEPKPPAKRTPPSRPQRAAELERLATVPVRGRVASVWWGVVSGAAWGLSVGVIYGLFGTFDLFAWLPHVPGGTVFIGSRLPVPLALVAVVWLGVGFAVYRDRYAALDAQARAQGRKLANLLENFERRQAKHRRLVEADEQRFRQEQQRYRGARRSFQAAQQRYRKEKRVWDHSWTCVDCGRSWHADRDLKDQR